MVADAMLICLSNCKPGMWRTLLCGAELKHGTRRHCKETLGLETVDRILNGGSYNLNPPGRL
eukprot:1148648-Pelagomonas_calceolata.AAC.2